MKYLKPLSPVLVGTSESDFKRFGSQFNSTEYTATLGLTTLCSDGSREQLQGIYITRSQLEQIRDEINNYLRNTAKSEPKLGIADSLQKPEATAVTSNFDVNITGDSNFSKEEEIGKLLLEIARRVTETQGRQSNEAEPKPKLRINPELVKLQESWQVRTEPYRASIIQEFNTGDRICGSVNLYALGKSEEEARATLDVQFEALVLQCVDAAETKSEASNATFQEQFSKLKEELSNQSPKVKAFVEAVNRITQSEVSKPTPNPDNSEKVDETPASESQKTEPQKTEEKSQVFKLNPNRVASRRDPTIEGYAQWEARTTLYFGETPLEVVASGYMTEERAREILDYKVERLIDGMTH